MEPVRPGFFYPEGVSRLILLAVWEIPRSLIIIKPFHLFFYLQLADVLVFASVSNSSFTYSSPLQCIYFPFSTTTTTTTTTTKTTTTTTPAHFSVTSPPMRFFFSFNYHYWSRIFNLRIFFLLLLFFFGLGLYLQLNA